MKFRKISDDTSVLFLPELGEHLYIIRSFKQDLEHYKWYGFGTEQCEEDETSTFEDCMQHFFESTYEERSLLPKPAP